MGGFGNETMCKDTLLASKGAVVVTFNYRLGMIGFIAHEGIEANFGIWDQTATLRWVRSNVS